MRTLSFALVGLLAGSFTGYMGGVLVFCALLHPDSPQCGLVAVFVTGPLGAVAGIVVSVLLALRGRR